jgi:hypothetical protein
MKMAKILVIALIGFISMNFSTSDPQDTTSIIYYSAFLTLNLNLASETSKIIYHLSGEQEFNKKLFYNELNKIEQSISYANDDIANIIYNSNEDKKMEIDKYLKNIDTHLAQVSIDIKQIREVLNKGENISRLISDLYYQIKSAETEDHSEIIKIQHLKTLEEPILMNQ